MLTYYHDPRGLLKKDIFPLDTNLTIIENLQKIFTNGLDANLHRFILNGVEVDPFEFDQTRKANALDSIDIIYRQQGIDPISWVVIAVVAIVAAVAVSALTPKPKIPNDVGSSKESPNNRLTGQTNIARLYQAKPDVYGERRVFPDLISSPTYEYINNIKYVTEMMCVGMGLYEKGYVRYADNELEKIDGSSYKIFEPGDVIPEIIEAFSSPEVDGQEIPAYGTTESILYEVEGNTYNNPGMTGVRNFVMPKNKDFDYFFIKPLPRDVRIFYNHNPMAANKTEAFWWAGKLTSVKEVNNEYHFTFDNLRNTAHLEMIPPSPQILRIRDISFSNVGPYVLPKVCNEFWFNLVFPRGLKARVNIKVTWYKVDNENNEIKGTREEKVIAREGNTLNAAYGTYKIKTRFGLARYAVFMERLTGPTSDEKPSQVKLEWLAAIQVRKKVIANDTLIRVITKATEQAMSYRERKINLVIRRKTITYNHETKQIDYTLRPSRSFADAILHTWVVIAKKDPVRLNLDELYAIERSLVDPRLGYFDFTFDDKDISLGQRIQTICNAARVSCSKDGLQYRFVRNEHKSQPRYQFDSRNLAASDSGGSISYKIHEPSSFNGIELEYIDARNANPNGTDKKAYIKLRINQQTGAIEQGSSPRPYKIQLAGCTNYYQAMNRAQLEARILLYGRTSVDDVALMDAAYLPIGSRVRWIDTYDKAVVSGEILDISNDKFTVNEYLDLDKDKNYRISITDEYGNPSDWLPFNVIDNRTFSANYSKAFISNKSNVQCGSRFIIAEQELEKLDFIITGKKPKDEHTIGISLTLYDDRMYEYDEKTLPFKYWDRKIAQNYRAA